MAERNVKISVVIPARNAQKVLPRCLDAIGKSSYTPYELTVVDDDSTDSTAAIARRSGANVLETNVQSGPGAARNLGAQASTGDILFFVDADVLIQPNTFAIVASHFEKDSSLAAVFGSYDSDPSEPNFLSQYKNLQHHYVHQTANREATTFWAGCGAVQRDVFLKIGGFDSARYPKPSIEDIELGYRLAAHGHRTVLDKTLCVKHLKKWTFQSHIRTEIFHRAAPWSRLVLESRELMRDLNLKISDRISGGLTWLFVLFLSLVAFDYFFLFPAAISLAVLLILNRGLYSFFWRHRGLRFVLKAIPMHLLHYWYSTATFALCCLLHPFDGLLSRARRTSVDGS
jgi:glycosyltransferase involved in cell wall biosynthesis